MFVTQVSPWLYRKEQRRALDTMSFGRGTGFLFFLLVCSGRWAQAQSEEVEPIGRPSLTWTPSGVISRDSDGNVRERVQMETEAGFGDHLRVGVLLGQRWIASAYPQFGIRTEKVRDVTGSFQWKPNNVLHLTGQGGMTQVLEGYWEDGDVNPEARIPVGRFQARITPPGGVFQVDLRFNRSLFDLSPLLVANRVIRNEVVVRPELTLPKGWRMRGLLEAGPMTGGGERNLRYATEYTLGHMLGEKSEIYGTYSTLRFGRPSEVGYYAPNLVEMIEGAWRTDIDREDFSVSLDFGVGRGRARDHGDTFGPWGQSLRAESYASFFVGEGRELRFSAEFYSNQFNPALSASAAWRYMSVSAAMLVSRW